MTGEYSVRDIVRVSLVHMFAICGIFFMGAPWFALMYCLSCFYFKHFVISAFYHRYFSHRSFKTSRSFQFLMAFLGTAGGQKGPLSWATSHRKHHLYTDRPGDPHSPYQLGFAEAYIGWVLRKNALKTDPVLVSDFKEFPELVWIDQSHFLGTFVFMIWNFLFGYFVETALPQLQTSMWQVVFWGFLISTLLNAHTAMLINTLCHSFGTKTFSTNDQSRNVWWLWPLAVGENWHNNHHASPKCAHTKHFWWEIDLIYLGLLFLKKMGLIWSLIDHRTLALKDLKESKYPRSTDKEHQPSLGH